MLSKAEILKGLDIYEQYVKKYDEEFRKRNKIPKNYEYRPYRWCSKDIVFSLLVVRHNRQGNFIEADVCLIANPPQFVENSGAKVAMGFLLSEAYKCSGSMEIVFTKNVEGGRVPAYICDLALEYGIKLNHVFEGHITPFEARQFYMELVGFSKPVKEKIMKLSVEGRLSPERACFMVIGGVWSLPEAEAIILSNTHPERVLMSLSSPDDRILYLNDILVSRSAILGGALDRKLLKPELIENGQVVESEDEETPLSIDFDPAYYAKIYQSEVELVVPWIKQNNLVIKPGQQMVVMIRARSDSEIRKFFLNDLEDLKSLVTKYKEARIENAIFFLTPRDFEDIPLVQQEQIVNLLQQQGVYIMVSPDSVSSLDKEAIRRLETGRMVRQQ
ncbi:MAG TPA: hypothetical protein VF837_05355 [Patescibacteria group bacterium]